MAGADTSDGASDGESVATDPDLEAGSDGEVPSTVDQSELSFSAGF